MLGLSLWVLQILTALYLSVGLYVHIFIAPLTDRLILNILFVAVAVFHGLNGIWGIIEESLRGRGWKIVEKSAALLKDFRHSREAGHFIFIVHRLTGIFLFLYVIQHIFTNSFISAYLSIDGIFITELLRNDVINYLALLSIGFHTANGIRLIFIELSGLTWLQRKLAYSSLFLGALFALYVIIF